MSPRPSVSGRRAMGGLGLLGLLVVLVLVPPVASLVSLSSLAILFVLVALAGFAARARTGGSGRGRKDKEWASPMVRRLLARLDDAMFEGEKLVVALALAVMVAVVFLDVTWRTANGLTVEGSIVWASLIVGASLLAAVTARWPGVTLRRRLVFGCVAGAGAVATCVVVARVPNGFGWSQRLALALMLWVGMLGGSMATRTGRHIAVDAVRRVLPDRLRRPFGMASALLAATICAFMAARGAVYARANYLDWVGSDFTAFMFESLPIPYWAATVSIPIGFGLMALRFVAEAVVGQVEIDVLTAVGGGDLRADATEASTTAEAHDDAREAGFGAQGGAP